MPKSLPRVITPMQVFNRYRDGLGGAWIFKGTNADLRDIAHYLKIVRGNMTKDELIEAIVEKAPELK